MIITFYGHCKSHAMIYGVVCVLGVSFVLIRFFKGGDEH